ncbi:cell division cycle-associated 7 [Chlorella sorokiniana]|uniref:Cell division cycle-associated 7 n=1 Tax=Chlorella sorokiniana TaxID=3076 RepID=A0A2P6U238_CHLSO|nr:cell division cycle-associated 7 [Chlorella sorokiniana]|eukprot:PRW60383.1 cell division cycle-associated 7 [Chlorella sorokiniana]
MVGMTEMERQRAERMRANAEKLKSLGIQEAMKGLEAAAVAAAPARPKPAPRKRKMYEIEIEVRRSGRLQGDKPQYNEDDLFAKELGIDRLDLVAAPRRRRVGMDPSHLHAIRTQRIREVDGEDAEIPRGPFDSGLGVRIQGGRVYDSKYGVTCHWCRQKTLEEHVTCTHPDCGGGKRLPVSFCKLCLKNRHGEDIFQAEASGSWVCPRCRGSCGDGCTVCCNCGPCRKAAGLSATGQLINEARRQGFDNVHDFLVHRSTGETPEEVAARKQAAAWGAWLDVPFDAEAAAAAREAAAAAEEAEEEAGGSGSEPAAAAAAVQLDGRPASAAAAKAQPRRRSGRRSSAAKAAEAGSSKAALPEGAGAALLVWAAVRWHRLSAAFCAAAQKLAAAPAPKRMAAAKQPAAKQPAASQQPKPATKRPASKAATPAAAAPRRSGRGQQTQQAQQAKLPAKVTAFFQPSAGQQKAAAAATKAAAVVLAAAEPAAKRAKVAAVEPPRPRGRLGLRARK